MNTIVNDITNIHNENFDEQHDFSYFQEIYDNERYLFYILKSEDDEEVIGYIIYYDTIESYDLFEIAVRKSRQGQGIANKLLKMDEYKLSKRNIFLEVREDNEIALKLYRKCRFKEISQRKHYYGRNKNAIIMIKEKS